MSNDNSQYSEDVFKVLDFLEDRYKSELELLWQRSVFVASFLLLLFTGYGSYVLKSLEIVKDKEAILYNKFVLLLGDYMFNSVSICILSVAFILSSIWYLIARGSKACFEQYENAIGETYKKYIKDKIYGSEFLRPYFGISMPKSIFSAGAFSVSKLNIIIPMIFMCLSFVLIVYHTIYLFHLNMIRDKAECWRLLLVTIIPFLSIGVCIITYCISKSSWHLKKKHKITKI